MDTKNKLSFDYYILLFFIVSVFGWLWEVALYLVNEHKFVNRGIMIGPYLPIYGAGALFLYLVLKRWEKKPLYVFVISITLCSALEYFSGYILEKMWGVKWWDYSEMFLNLHGRICFMSCFMFGVGGIFLIFFIIPIYTVLYKKVSDKTSQKVRMTIALLLLLLFVADAAYSADFPNVGRGITYRI
ncbi:MAG: putative ABC transporter permease [Lachnospiraceae bacterium]|nr:putative ABC transporter permease [Lachnospiraceae bacterium]